MTKQKVPKLRFPEFTGEWKIKKLNKICARVIRKNKSLIDSLPLTISAQHGLVNQITYFNKIIASQNLSGYTVIKKGEFAYNKSYSKDYAFGAIKRLNKYEHGLLSSLYICFFVKEGTNSDYIKSYFETKKWHKEISMIAVEGARNHGLLNIAINDFFSIKIAIPSLPEQEKIADFLALFDKEIELEEKKLELLKENKKGYMQKIFNQEIRFKDEFRNDYPQWEEKKLGEIANINTGKLNANAMVIGGKYRFYTCAKDFFRINSFSFDEEALLISGNGANVGYIHYYKGKFDAYQRTYVLSEFSERIIYMKYFLQEKLKKKIKKEKNQGNTPYIVLNTLKNMKVQLPSLPEQEKIANFLSMVDEEIELMENKIEKLKEVKKGLLQEMFI